MASLDEVLKPSPQPIDDATGLVAHAQLAFGSEEAPLLKDLDALHEKLSLALNLRSLQPRGRGVAVAQRSALRLAGDIGLTAVASTPTQAVVDEHHEAVLALLSHGRIHYRIAGRDWTALGGTTAVYLPGEAMRVRTDHHVGLAFNLNPPMLARHLIELDQRLSLERALLALQRPWAIDLSHPASRGALQQLTLVTRLLDTAGPSHPSSAILSLLQDRLYQLSARFLLTALQTG